MLDTVEVRREHREFASVTGTWRGMRLSVVSTGIGTDNMEIAVAEILAITERPTMVRIGSCGVLRDDIALGDLVISSGSVRLESTTSYYVHDGYPGGGGLHGGGRAGRGGRDAGPPGPRRPDGDRARLLRRAGTPDPAAAHPLP